MKQIFLLLLLSGSFAGLDSHASLRAYCRKRFSAVIVAAEPKFPFRSRTYVTATGKRRLRFDQQLGFGASATGYVLNNPEVMGVQWPGKVAVRVPHTFELFPEFVRQRKTPTASQLDSYEFLVSQIPTIASSEFYPRRHAWGEGKLPIIPVLAKLPTDKGELTAKPLAVGKEIKDLRREYPNGLPAEMVASLREIFALSSAIWDRVPIPKHLATVAGDHQYSLDVDPRNLVWVKVAENPALAERLGLTRDTFLCYEPDFSMSAEFRAQEMTFQDYLRKVNQESPAEIAPALDRIFRPLLPAN